MLLLILILQFIEIFSLDPRAVHVNIEASFLLRPNDLTRKNSVINNLKSLLLGLEHHFRAESPEFRTQDTGELTKFLQYVGGKLIKQNDDYLRNLTIALKSTFHDYYNRSKMKTYLKDEAMELHIMDSLNDWDKLSVKDMKLSIKRALDNDKSIFCEVIRFFDRYFNETDAETLNDIAAYITGETKNSTDINKIIRGALNFIIFKRLRHLSNVARHGLFAELHEIINSDNIQGRLYNSNTNIKVENKLAKGKSKKKIESDELEEPPEKFNEPGKEELQMKGTKKILEQNDRFKNKSKDERTEEISESTKHYKVTTKLDDIKISHRNKHGERELKKKKKNAEGHESSKTDLEDNKKIYKGKDKSRRSQITEDVTSIELLRQEGEIFLKKVEEEVNKIN